MSCRITSKDYLDRNGLTNQVVKQIQRHGDVEEICISDIMDYYVAEWENEIEKCYFEIEELQKTIVESTIQSAMIKSTKEELVNYTGCTGCTEFEVNKGCKFKDCFRRPEFIDHKSYQINQEKRDEISKRS